MMLVIVLLTIILYLKERKKYFQINNDTQLIVRYTLISEMLIVKTMAALSFLTIRTWEAISRGSN